jgi:4-hydroxy-3-methylbut-2-enyl diphosphate reductase
MTNLAVPGASFPQFRRQRPGGKPLLQVLLAAPRGFCAGVERAIASVEDALAFHGSPVFVRRPIVHNLAVVRGLEHKGAVFVEELDEIPDEAVVVLSAHGVAPGIRKEASRRGLKVYDAVCPLVAKVHRHVLRYWREGRHVLLVGHRGHPEIDGTLGHLPDGAATLVSTPEDAITLDFPPDAPLAYAIQTTFSVDEAAEITQILTRRFGNLAAPLASDICYATTNRQAAISALARRAHAVIVVGEAFSSNARRLAETASRSCNAVQLVAGPAELDWSQLPRRGGTVAVTAAASTPEDSVSEVVAALGSRYLVSTAQVGGEERVRFRRVEVPLPAPD